MATASANHLPASGCVAPMGIAGAVSALRPRFARFHRRFHAWWEGYVEDGLPPESPATPTAETTGGDGWTAPRIKIAEMVWGDGFAFPGGVDHIVEMVKPMALSPKKSMLYLGAGLGGGPRAIANTFGTWITGLEGSLALATAGMDHSKRAGLRKRAPIIHFNPETIELPPKKFDAICARHALHGVAGPERLLREIAKAIRPQGHVLISDFAPGPQAAMADGEPSPITLERLADQLVKLGFDVRIAEDVTLEFRRLVLKGWADLAQFLEGKSLAPDEARAVAQEILVWQERVAAFSANTLRVVRIHAIKTLI